MTVSVPPVDSDALPSAGSVAERSAESRLAAAYAEAVARLDSLTNYEKRLQSARAWGLDRVYRMAEKLGNPFNAYATLHVTGTKGKGTTSHLLARLLMATGKRVGLYTSPHVRDLRERIKIDGRPIEKVAFVRAFNTVWDSFAGLVMDSDRPVSYFEMMTHTAFVAFQQHPVDVAVIEVGLGGKLDATNILQRPAACVLTPISLDHVKILGNTVEEIAADKSGILKPGAHVIVADQQAGAAQVIRERAAAVASPLVWQLGRDVTYRWQAANGVRPDARSAAECRYEVTVQTPRGSATLPLAVPAQAGAGNVATAWSALQSLGWAPTVEAAREALRDFRVEGRFERQRLCERDWIFDGAHNVASTGFLIEAVRHAYPDRAVTLVFGCMHDKDALQMLQMWRPHVKRLVLAQAQSHRANDRADLRLLAQQAGFAVEQLQDAAADAALGPQAAQLTAADAQPLILVTGSFYLVGDVLTALAPPAS